MVELGELEKHQQDFADRNVRLVVISNDDQPTAQLTQKDFPHLIVISDADQNMARALQVVHHGAGPTGNDTNVPTTFIVDGTGHVRWIGSTGRFVVRFSPSELLSAIDETSKQG